MADPVNSKWASEFQDKLEFLEELIGYCLEDIRQINVASADPSADNSALLEELRASVEQLKKYVAMHGSMRAELNSKRNEVWAALVKAHADLAGEGDAS